MNRLRFAQRLFTAVLSAASLSGSARADLLSDAQLWLDPATLPYALYDRQVIDTPGSSFTWADSAGRIIVGASILPTLREGVWLEPGRTYSQDDYFYQPNIDYRADLSAGVLTSTFDRSGLYHIRATFSDGSQETRAVLVNSAIAGPGSEAGPNSTGPTTQIAQPHADLHLVSGSPGANDSMANIAFDQLNRDGRRVAWAPDTLTLVNTICAWEMELGRPITVAIYAHGAPGLVQIGNTRVGVAGQGLDYSPRQLHNAITGKVSSVYFFSCSLGRDGAGELFSTELSGGDIMVYNWNRTMWVGGEQRWAVNSDATFRCIPAPGPALLIAFGLMTPPRRRRYIPFHRERTR